MLKCYFQSSGQVLQHNGVGKADIQAVLMGSENNARV